MATTHYLLLHLTLLVFQVLTFADSKLNGPCRTKNNAAGVCKLLNHCPSIGDVIDIAQEDICAYSRKGLVVCCNDDQIERSTVTEERPSVKYCNKLLDTVGQQIVRTIINGEKANHAEFPHMVALSFGNSSKICGGTLISSDYVITAAHCILNRIDPYPDKILLGSANIKKSARNKDLREEEILEDSICIHPEYNRKYSYHDIALIRLKNPIKSFTSELHPACLHNSNQFPKNDLQITGWGGIDRKNTILSTDLLKANNMAYDLEKCKQRIIANNLVPNGIVKGMLCTSGSHNGASFCLGDSGGPLQSLLSSTQFIYNLVGVMSFGTKECGTDYPAVYTEIAHYLDWIEKIVWPTGPISNQCKTLRRRN